MKNAGAVKEERVPIKQNKITFEIKNHNHMIAHGLAKVEKAHADKKRRGETTEETRRSILQDVMMNTPVVCQLLKRDTFARDVRRQKSRHR